MWIDSDYYRELMSVELAGSQYFVPEINFKKKNRQALKKNRVYGRPWETKEVEKKYIVGKYWFTGSWNDTYSLAIACLHDCLFFLFAFSALIILLRYIKWPAYNARLVLDDSWNCGDHENSEVVVSVSSFLPVLVFVGLFLVKRKKKRKERKDKIR